MTRIVLLVIYILSATTLGTGTVYAHETKEDNGTILFLHINPNDTPVVDKPAGLRLLITSKNTRFPSSHCACYLHVIDKGRELLTQRVFTDGELSSVVPYAFSHAGVFQIKVTGLPENASDFKPFSISFNVRVHDNAKVVSLYAQYIYPIWGATVLIIGAVILYTRKIRRPHD
jgi:hypothetical protein